MKYDDAAKRIRGVHTLNLSREHIQGESKNDAINESYNQETDRDHQGPGIPMETGGYHLPQNTGPNVGVEGYVNCTYDGTIYF